MDWYQHSGYPAQSANGDSASARSEFDAIALNGTKLPALTGSALRIVRVNAAGTALESVTTATATLETYASVQAGTQIGLAAAKTTPVDADVFPALDSAAANILTKFTWANIKATMYAAFGVLLAAGTGKTTPTGADSLAISDSAAAGATKTLTFTNLVTYLAGLCSAGWNAATATLATTATNQFGGTVAATTISAIGLIFANGGQIEFPATPNPSADANTLDDYKEGSYVPTGTMNTSGTVTITSSTITYTKIGKRVFVSGFIVFNSVSSPLGNLILSALPWASYGNSSFGVFSSGGGASGGPIEAYIGNSANIVLGKAAGGDFAMFGSGDLVNNQQIYISGSYIAAN